MAPRRLLRVLHGCARGAGLAVCLWLAGAATAQERISYAGFSNGTNLYQHCILGDCMEYTTLTIGRVDASGTAAWRRVRLNPREAVFEDITPRLWDVTGDGAPEVVVVQTSVTQGASLAIYGWDGVIAQTPYIGQPNRWLAPVGIGDLDGDGRIEIGYVDRPHLRKTLVILEWNNAELVVEAEVPGLSNHRIGEAMFLSTMRVCNGRPEFLSLNADWTSIMATRWTGTGYESTEVGPFQGIASLTMATLC